MSKKIITLEQYKKGRGPYGGTELSTLEEGDKVQSFKVIDVEEIECAHDERRYKIERDDGDPHPHVEATCKMCGDVKIFELDAVKEE